MRFRVIATAALLFSVAAPASLTAQFPGSGVRMQDIERGVAIARVVIAMTHRSGTHSGRPAGGRSDGGTATRNRTTVGHASASRTARLVIASGEEFLGVPYVWGGSTPAGFDCSGFVQYVFREHGVELPRTSRQMAHAGKAVAPHVAALVPGDLMLFSGASGDVIKHVAIYAGDNRILHSSSSGHGVRYDDLVGSRGKYYITHLVAARRVIQDGRSLVEPLSLIERASPFDYLDPPDDGAPAARNPWADGRYR